jgi:phage terminase large subunit-like protein
VNCIVGIEEAGQQRGFIDDISQAPEMGSYVVRPQKPSGDKYNRALPWAARAELGNVILCRGAWNQGFADECDSFTPDDTHDHDDRVDAVSGGYLMIQSSGSMIYTTAQIIQEKTAQAIDADPTGFGKAILPGINIQEFLK